MNPMRVFRSLAILLVVTLTAGRCAIAASTTQPASPEFIGIDGKTYQPLAVDADHIAVLVFVLQDCPVCNGNAPTIEKLASTFAGKGARFYLIHVDPALTPDEARKHAHDYNYHLPVLIDRRHELVKSLEVRAVPTAVLIGHDGTVQYQGRIDNRYVAIGKSRDVATVHDLFDALTSVLAGKSVEHPRMPTIGCAVPDLPGESGK
jgi:peroxiredoxin